MRLALVSILIVACAPADTHNPIIIGGGGGGGGGGSPDAGSGSGSGMGSGSVIDGRVCLLSTIRDFTSCATSGADGITVSLPGVGSATTASDGTFEIDRPTGSMLTWSLSGTNIMPSTIGFAASTTIPAVSTTAFTALADDNSVSIDPGLGTIIGELFQNGAPVMLATAVSSPAAEYPTFYSVTSNTDVDAWDGTTSDTLGTFMIANLQLGSTSITYTPDGGISQQIDNYPATAGSVTFVTFSF